MSEPRNDLTPAQQAEYEAALAKKAKVGRALAVLICDIFVLLGLLPKNAVMTALAGVCLFLTLTGKPAAKWVGAALGGIWAVIGALTLADIPSAGLKESDLGYYKTAGIFVLVFGAVSAVLFYKSRLIAAYFEYKASINRKII